jgi:hypothetical protein
MSKLLNAHFHGCGGCRTAAAGPHKFQLHQWPIDVNDLAVATIALQVRPQLIQYLTAATSRGVTAVDGKILCGQNAQHVMSMMS